VSALHTHTHTLHLLFSPMWSASIATSLPGEKCVGDTDKLRTMCKVMSHHVARERARKLYGLVISRTKHIHVQLECVRVWSDFLCIPFYSQTRFFVKKKESFFMFKGNCSKLIDVSDFFVPPSFFSVRTNSSKRNAKSVSGS